MRDKDEYIRFLENKVSKLGDMIDKLQKRLAYYENPHTPPSARRLKKKKPEKGISGPRYPGRPKGHEGTTRPTPEPDETKTTSLEECPHCQAKLGEPECIERRIIEDIPEPQPVKITEFLMPHYECPGCGRDITAWHPDCPQEGVFGKNTQAHVTLLKYTHRLPHRKISDVLKTMHGITISPATILDITRRASDRLRTEYEQIKNRIREAYNICIDETGIKVDGQNHHTWGFISSQNDVLIAIRKSRGSRVLQEVLGDKFAGIITCDGWKAYKTFTRRLQRCWAHLLREARELSRECAEAVPIYNSLAFMYKTNQAFLETGPPTSERLDAYNHGKALLRYWAGKWYQEEPVRKLAQKIGNGLDHWLTYILHPGVEPTNNRGENVLREEVVQRKIFGTLRNGKGTRIRETVMSVLATWERKNLNLYTQLIQIL